MLRAFALVDKVAPVLSIDDFMSRVFPKFHPEIDFHSGLKSNATFLESTIEETLPIYDNDRRVGEKKFALHIKSMCDGRVEFLLIAMDKETNIKYIFDLNQDFFGKELCAQISEGELNFVEEF